MREQLAVPKIGQCARLSLTVFELQMCKNYVTHIVPVPAHQNDSIGHFLRISQECLDWSHTRAKMPE